MSEHFGGLDVAAIRADFPILGRMIGDKPLVYLDSAATSQKPRQVIDAVSDFYSNHNANAHRGIYTLGEESTEAFEGARAKLAAFFGAPDPRTIVFTRGTTESLNLVAQGWDITVSPPEQFAAVLRAEFERWSTVVKNAGIKAN